MIGTLQRLVSIITAVTALMLALRELKKAFTSLRHDGKDGNGEEQSTKAIATDDRMSRRRTSEL